MEWSIETNKTRIATRLEEHDTWLLDHYFKMKKFPEGITNSLYTPKQTELPAKFH